MSTKVIVETFAVGPLQCNCTIFGDSQSREAIVVDGGDGVDEVVRRLAHHGLRARFLVHTHAHIDHIFDLGRLRDLTGGSGLLHPADLPLYHTLALQARWIGLTEVPPVVALDGDLADGDTVRAGTIRLDVLHTPGHTPGSVCFGLREGDDAVTTRLLTGDTLF